MIQSMNSSAVPGARAVTGMHIEVGADRHALRAGLVLVELGVVDLVADVDDVAVPGLVEDGAAADQVLERVGREPARELLLLEQGLPSRSRARSGSTVLRSKPLIRLASPIASWKSSRMNIRPSPSGLRGRSRSRSSPRPRPRARRSRSCSRCREPSTRCSGPTSRLVVEVRDAVVVLEQVAVEARRAGPPRSSRATYSVRRPDHVVAGAAPELDHHRLEVVEVDLVDLDAVLLAELLLQRRVHVLGPVVDQQVAVDLGLIDAARAARVDRARRPCSPRARSRRARGPLPRRGARAAIRTAAQSGPPRPRRSSSRPPPRGRAPSRRSAASRQIRRMQPRRRGSGRRA